ncbi:MAG TPA: DUF1684 domain-containing protein [Luteimonas sp.]|nr:DUF1684 domain-containing protein [Luteimonas sp.]
MLRTILLPALAGCALALSGCGDKPQAAAGDNASKAVPAFVAEENAWRAQRDANLRKPDGWTSLVGLHWIELKAHYVGSSADSGIRLAKGPPRMGLLQQEGEHLFFTPEKGVAITIDGQPLDKRVELHDDMSESPSVVGFDDGKGQMTVIARDGRHALRVKHADADTRTRFAGLQYWPADPSWKIDAKFVPNAPGKTIQVADIIGAVNEEPNPGAVEFQRDGRTWRIEALDEGDGSLFLVFADRTNGHGSYGAGRFLYADKPGPDGKVVLDFNQAYNPPCAFTPFATCPLPPPENRLDLAVTAGEQKYAGGSH